MTPKNDHFVLTGCASGIARYLASMLVTRGYRVCATDIDLNALVACADQEAWPSGEVLLRRLDVREPETWEEVLTEVVARFGTIDVLMNIAGYVRPGWIHELPVEAIHTQIDVNLKGVIFGTQAAARHMTRQRRGHIINVGSFSSLLPIPGISAYCASKYAVRGFSLAAAQELRPFGVSVTVVCPEIVQTPMLEKERQYQEAATVLSPRKTLTVDQIADVILNRVLPRKPLEAYVPRVKGRFARLVDLAPRSLQFTVPILHRRGLKHLSYHTGD